MIMIIILSHAEVLSIPTGELSLKLLKRCPDGHLVAVDYSPRMIEVATAKLTEAQMNHRVTFVQGDFCHFRDKMAKSSRIK